MNGKLVRLHSTNNNLRTKEVEGVFDQLPTVGQGFKLIGESLDFEGGSRLIFTSNVIEVVRKDIGVWSFQTLNSFYELHINENNEQ